MQMINLNNFIIILKINGFLYWHQINLDIILNYGVMMESLIFKEIKKINMSKSVLNLLVIY